MGLLDKIFQKSKQGKNTQSGYFQTLTAYSPSFTNWGGELYESELVRYGKFTRSRQTEAYVREVMKRYGIYRQMIYDTENSSSANQIALK